MSERPLRWWSHAALSGAAAAFDAPWREWCVGWGLAAASPFAENASELESAERVCDWRPFTADARLWLAFSGVPPVDALESLLFAGASRPPAEAGSQTLAREVAAGAWRDLSESMDRVWTEGSTEATRPHPTRTIAEPELPTASEWRPWSGAIVVRFRTVVEPTASLALFISGQDAIPRFGLDVPAHASTRDSLPALASMAEAVSAHPVRLRIELDEVEIDLGSLKSLRSGDVLPLRHRLDEPLHARVGGTRERERRDLCQALLGRRDGQRGVELVSADPT